MTFGDPTGVRGKFAYRDGVLVAIKKRQAPTVNAPFVKRDEVDAFENPVSGEMETSMSTYRRKLKNAGYFEKGNDRIPYTLPTRTERFEEIREVALEAERQIKYGMGKSTSGEREVWERQTRESQN